MLVAAFILGGVVLLGLIILALIKMIIWWISRREVKEWEKERGKNTITSVSQALCIKWLENLGSVRIGQILRNLLFAVSMSA